MISETPVRESSSPEILSGARFRTSPQPHDTRKNLCNITQVGETESRRDAEVSKNFNIALSWNDGALERSITTWAPSTASFSLSAAIVLTPNGEAANRLVAAPTQNGDALRANQANDADHDDFHS